MGFFIILSSTNKIKNILHENGHAAIVLPVDSTISYILEISIKIGNLSNQVFVIHTEHCDKYLETIELIHDALPSQILLIAKEEPLDLPSSIPFIKDNNDEDKIIELINKNLTSPASFNDSASLDKEGIKRSKSASKAAEIKVEEKEPAEEDADDFFSFQENSEVASTPGETTEEEEDGAPPETDKSWITGSAAEELETIAPMDTLEEIEESDILSLDSPEEKYEPESIEEQEADLPDPVLGGESNDLHSLSDSPLSMDLPSIIKEAVAPSSPPKNKEYDEPIIQASEEVEELPPVEEKLPSVEEEIYSMEEEVEEVLSSAVDNEEEQEEYEEEEEEEYEEEEEEEQEEYEEEEAFDLSADEEDEEEESYDISELSHSIDNSGIDEDAPAESDLDYNPIKPPDEKEKKGGLGETLAKLSYEDDDMGAYFSDDYNTNDQGLDGTHPIVPSNIPSTKNNAISAIKGYDVFEDSNFGDSSFNLAGDTHTLPDGLGKVVPICAAKGGVGKSTLTIWIAEGLCAAGHSVALIDANIGQPDLSKNLDVHHMGGGISTLATDEGFTEADLENAMIDIEGLGSILPGPPKPDFVNTEKAVAVMHLAINYLRKKYDYILLDTPVATMEEKILTHFLLQPNISQHVVVVVKPHDVTLQDTVAWVTSIKEPVERGGLKFDIDNCAGIINRSGAAAEIDAEVVKSYVPMIGFYGEIPHMEDVIDLANEKNWSCPEEAREDLGQFLNLVFGVNLSEPRNKRGKKRKLSKRAEKKKRKAEDRFEV